MSSYSSNTIMPCNQTQSRKHYTKSTILRLLNAPISNVMPNNFAWVTTRLPSPPGDVPSIETVFLMRNASSTSYTAQGNSENKYHVSWVSKELQVWEHVRDKGLRATHHHETPPTPRCRHLSLNQIIINPPKVHTVTVPGRGTEA